jgi:predicted acylesterase/phospholipase RssA/CRP-like cAMP-binding protein
MSLADQQIRLIIEEYFGAGVEPALLGKLEEVALTGGEWLFRHGDPGDSLFFLVRGRLQVWDESIHDEEAGPRLLGEVVPGESVGEVGLLSGEARSAGIRAIRDSLLLKLDRTAFESLARDHPSLVMKLAANIATLVQRSTSKAAASIRRLSTISLVPLSDAPAVRKFCRELVASLEQFGKTLDLSPGTLGQHGAPVERLAEGEQIPEALLHWLHDQENAYRYVVYSCSGVKTPWKQLAIRQSDIVLYVGEAGGEPIPAEWSEHPEGESGASVARPTLVLLQPSSKTPISGTAAWLDARKPDFHLHVRADNPDDVNRVARIVSGNAIGLVLAGGAARGIAHLGVYKAMLELGITPDWIGGVSIGSIFGAGMAMGLDIDDALDAARDAMVVRKPFTDFTLPIISLVRGRRMDKVLNEFFKQNIEDLPIPYFCISCKLDDGALNVHESGPLPTALRASASMPGIFPPAVVAHRLTVDGSVINNLPVDVMQQKPVGRVIAVDLSSQKTYEVPYETIPSPWSVIGGQLLPFTRKHRVPRLMTTLLKSTELGTLAKVQEQGQRADLLLHPPVRKFGMTEVKSFDEMVEVTYRYALEALASWQKNIPSGGK